MLGNFMRILDNYLKFNIIGSFFSENFFALVFLCSIAVGDSVPEVSVGCDHLLKHQLMITLDGKFIPDISFCDLGSSTPQTDCCI